MTIALPNVIAFVTGAPGGIGRELCKALKSAGATVIASGLAEAAPDLVADHYIEHDVTDAAAWARVADFVRTTYGRLDALVNTAGIAVVKSFEETSLSEWQRVHQVNVDSTAGDVNKPTTSTVLGKSSGTSSTGQALAIDAYASG